MIVWEVPIEMSRNFVRLARVENAVLWSRLSIEIVPGAHGRGKLVSSEEVALVPATPANKFAWARVREFTTVMTVARERHAGATDLRGDVGFPAAVSLGRPLVVQIPRHFGQPTQFRRKVRLSVDKIALFDHEARMWALPARAADRPIRNGKTLKVSCRRAAQPGICIQVVYLHCITPRASVRL